MRDISATNSKPTSTPRIRFSRPRPGGDSGIHAARTRRACGTTRTPTTSSENAVVDLGDHEVDASSDRLRWGSCGRDLLSLSSILSRGPHRTRLLDASGTAFLTTSVVSSPMIVALLSRGPDSPSRQRRSSRLVKGDRRNTIEKRLPPPHGFFLLRALVCRKAEERTAGASHAVRILQA